MAAIPSFSILQIPSFNGSASHLTFFGLGNTSPLWTDLEVVLRPEAEDGLVLYNGNSNDGAGDFLALFLSRGFVEFAFDNGDGVALVRYSTAQNVSVCNLPRKLSWFP